MAATKLEIYRWISDVFRRENFEKLETKIVGVSGKGEGYVGDIAFVTVSATKSDKSTKTFDLVVKYGKKNEETRNAVPIREAFQQEIFVYDTVLAAYKELEDFHNVKVLEGLLPKCFGTFLYDNQEVIALQNLKSLGYELHDKLKPLDLAHLRLTMEGYGKWHALSLVCQDKQPKKFVQLLGKMTSPYITFKDMVSRNVKIGKEFIFNELKKINELELCQRLSERLPTNTSETILEMVSENAGVNVFRHGDCWNNNFMFKYEDSDSTKPLNVTFLDFQVADFGSPVIDLAYHIYATASAEELLHFKELFHIYYSTLSKILIQFRCEPDKIFPYKELVRQWKKYSCMGVIWMGILLPFTMTTSEAETDISQMANGNITETFKASLDSYGHLIIPRMLAVVKHFLDFDDF